MSNENENFKAEYLTESGDYLIEADGDNFQPQRKPYMDDQENEQPDDSEFSVDQYEEPSYEPDENEDFSGDENNYNSDADESGEDGELEIDKMDSDEDSKVDVDALYTDLSEFFEDADEQKVKDWIQHVIDTENLKDDSEFLDFFEGADDMEESFNSYGGDEEAKDAEKEATEPEEDSDEDMEEHESNETPEEEAEEEENLKESYLQNLSDEVKKLMELKSKTTDTFLKNLYAEAIQKIKDKLQEKETVTESSINPIIQNFINASYQLSNSWDELGLNVVAGYPKYLPSFDDFVYDMEKFLISQRGMYKVSRMDDNLEESKKGVNPFMSKFTITFTNAKGKEKTKKVSAKNKKAAIAQFKEDNPDVEGKVSAEPCDCEEKKVVEENFDEVEYKVITGNDMKTYNQLKADGWKVVSSGDGKMKLSRPLDKSKIVIPPKQEEFYNQDTPTVSESKTFKVGDMVYDPEHNDIGKVLWIDPSNPSDQLRTDSNGMQDVSKLELYDPSNPKHKNAHKYSDTTPSTVSESIKNKIRARFGKK